MLAVFCLRLAVGMLAALLLVPLAKLNPRFPRTHCWIAFALALGAALFPGTEMAAWHWGLIGCTLVLTLLGSLVWSLEGAPGGYLTIVGALLTATAVLAQWTWAAAGAAPHWQLADAACAAAYLGTAMTAMLLGHFYLIQPTLSIAPLQRLLIVGGVSLLARTALALYGLSVWLAAHAAPSNEVVLLLSARWLVGLLVPLVLGWMAWESARIRSTQSATGILYVVVIFCFLGELTALLLLDLEQLPL